MVRLTVEWKKAGLKHVNRPVGGHRNGLTDMMFIDLYLDCDGDVQKMAGECGYKARSLAVKCGRLGLPPLNQERSQRRIDGSFLVDPRDIR